MTDTDIHGLVKRLRDSRATWDDGKASPTLLESEAADALESMQREVAELEKERDRLILAIADHQTVRSEYVGRIAELEGQRDAYNEKFQSECAKHDVTTHQRMQADRRVAELEAQIATRGEPVAYQILLASGRWADCAKRIYDAMEASGRSEAIRKLFTAPEAVPADMVMVPKKPSIGRLVSMAIRDDHGLGVAGYYDTIPIQFGPNHAQRLESAIRCMRQLYEEATGQGFYTADREDHYASIAAAPTKEQTCNTY